MREIPLAGGLENAHQTFTVEMAGRTIAFELDYMGYIDNPAWNLTLKERGEVLIAGLLLVGGCDILEPYHLGLGRLCLVGEPPTLDNLGVDNHLIWVAPDETI